MLDYDDEVKSLTKFIGCGFVSVIFFYLIIIAAIAAAVILVVGALR